MTEKSMGQKIAVTYQGHYGTTKQYAMWLAEELGAELFERNIFPVKNINDYDLIIHGGGIYAGGVLGTNLLRRFPKQRYVLFTVGLADPQTTDYTQILNRNLPKQIRQRTEVFHLRGGINYPQLNWHHSMMMKLMKKMNFDRKQYQDLSSEERQFVDTYGKQVNFTNRQSLEPLVKFVQNLNWLK